MGDRWDIFINELFTIVLGGKFKETEFNSLEFRTGSMCPSLTTFTCNDEISFTCSGMNGKRRHPEVRYIM